jgi:hypothetical protein
VRKNGAPVSFALTPPTQQGTQHPANNLSPDLGADGAGGAFHHGLGHALAR